MTDPERMMVDLGVQAYDGKAPCVRASEVKGVTYAPPHYCTKSFAEHGLKGCWAIVCERIVDDVVDATEGEGGQRDRQRLQSHQ